MLATTWRHHPLLITTIVGGMAALGLTGCRSESPWSKASLEDVRATYTEMATGITVEGVFTIVLEIDQSNYSEGETSEVYLDSLNLVDQQDYYTYYYDYEASNVAAVNAAGGLPYEATVGTTSRMQISWTRHTNSTDPGDLCSSALRGQIYLSLTDELLTFRASDTPNYYDEAPLVWTIDPCP